MHVTAWADFYYFCSTIQVLVVSGETGCGKTTQLPQFILEEDISSLCGADCSIICTQPRRISAISVAARISSERGESLGETVGYQIRLESRRSAQTRLLLCTTGVLLRQLVTLLPSFISYNQFDSCMLLFAFWVAHCLNLSRYFHFESLASFDYCSLSSIFISCLFYNCNHEE